MAAAKGAPKGTAVEVDGIELTVRIDPSSDYELAECSLVMADESATPDQRSRALVRQYHLVLGDDYGRVMGELRERNGGRLPTADVVSFVNRVIARVADVKN